MFFKTDFQKYNWLNVAMGIDNVLLIQAFMLFGVLVGAGFKQKEMVRGKQKEDKT